MDFILSTPFSSLKNIDYFSSQNYFLKFLQNGMQLNISLIVMGLIHWNAISVEANAFQPWDQLELLFLETPRCQKAVSGSNFRHRINEGNGRWYWAGVFGKISKFKRKSSSNQMGNVLWMIKGMFVHENHSCPVLFSIMCTSLFTFGWGILPMYQLISHHRYTLRLWFSCCNCHNECLCRVNRTSF